MTEPGSTSDKWHRTREVDDRKPNGLFDGFETYRTPTETDYRDLLTSGLVVPDTNVFLNLYRYNEQTRNDLMSLLRGLGDCLWVPRQVMVEFWRNREKVLQDPRDTDRTIKELIAHRDKGLTIIREWASRVGLPQERKAGLAEIILGAYESVTDGVTKLADSKAVDFARNTNIDPVLLELEPILRGRIGEALGKTEYQEAIKEAKRRGEIKQPPGYRDVGKGGEFAAGDYLIWTQLLREIKQKRRNVLIVTGDAKEDWWRRERGELRGPRPELAEEMSSFAGARLFMIRPESLLLLARRFLRINIRDESVEDIERIDKYVSEALRPSVRAIRDSWDSVLEAIKRRRRVAWMLLSNGTAASLDGDILTIEFPREGDVRGFMTSGCAEDLAEVIHDVLDFNLRIAAVARQPDYSTLMNEASLVAEANVVAKAVSAEDSSIDTNGFSEKPPF